MSGCSNDGQYRPGHTDVSSPDSTIKYNTSKGKNILNNIFLEERGGLQVSTAYLADEAGNLINAKNIVSIATPVYLTIQIKQGWIVTEGYVSPGAYQSITTHNGEPVVQSSDLFAGIQRIKTSDAATIRLKTLITTTRSDIAYYKVYFRVWDKQGTGEITGNYQLRLEE
ncbi:MAG TPA: hypothetical protein VGN63_08390 [Flavisolibacter sp.]|nr:hypothetical protein [Flavisolibacter sp.]